MPKTPSSMCCSEITPCGHASMQRSHRMHAPISFASSCAPGGRTCARGGNHVRRPEPEHHRSCAQTGAKGSSRQDGSFAHFARTANTLVLFHILICFDSGHTVTSSIHRRAKDALHETAGAVAHRSKRGAAGKPALSLRGKRPSQDFRTNRHACFRMKSMRAITRLGAAEKRRTKANTT